MTCKICSGSSLDVIYQGPVRNGRFGQLTPNRHQIRRCLQCHSASLDIVQDTKFYESDEYRQSVDHESSSDAYYRNHDGEQIRHLIHTGTDGWRRKVVADVGCGAGSFLDSVSGFGSKILAIEPSRTFGQELQAKGYDWYPYAFDALKDWSGKCDLVVSFSVLEHITDPVSFLREIHSLLQVGGKLVISTPNTNDVLLSYLGDDYARFYFRVAHLWYFDQISIENLMRSCGFSDCKVQHYQRFGLSNFLNWTRHLKPMGNESVDFVSPAMDAVWKAELERQGVSDYMMVSAVKA